MAASIDRLHDSATPVSFGHRLARSTRFRALFAEGMDLVEEAAAYLDGPGRADARALRPSLGGAYASESMRLTTRLMQIASWLLIRRAIVDGATDSVIQGQARFKVTAQGIVSSATIFVQLPAPLQSLANRSLRLQNRILHLDDMVKDGGEAGTAPPLRNAPAEQVARLRAVFCQAG